MKKLIKRLLLISCARVLKRPDVAFVQRLLSRPYILKIDIKPYN